MKKNLFMLMLTVLALASCNDDCDHNISVNGGGEGGGDFTYEYLSSGTGSWYEEAENEEFRPTVNGKFYDKYCNLVRSGETEGTYEISNGGTRMTETYTFMGQSQYADWKISNVKELSFVITSDQVGAHTYEKVVESYVLSEGQTKNISFVRDYPSYVVKSYSSTNEYIASVTADGVITARGEKGTVYIKIAHDQGNAWVKVVVGDDYADLWYDYSKLLDRDYAYMRELLGQAHSTADYASYTGYAYQTGMHDILSYINVYTVKSNGHVRQVDMHLRDAVPEDAIISYMNAHYYHCGNYGNQRHYSSAYTMINSRAAYAYDLSKKTISVFAVNDYMDQMGMYPLLHFDLTFGMTKEEVKYEMDFRGYSFMQSFDTYSFNGSDGYAVAGSESIIAVEFVYNPDNIVSQYWLYLSDTKDQAEILKYLKDNYVEATDEYEEGKGFIFYNDAKTIKLLFDVWNNAITVTNLQLKPVDLVILRNYWKGLGMRRNELIATFGTPYQEDSENIRYAPMTEYVTVVNYILNSSTGEVRLINLFLRDDVTQDVIKSYFDKLYTYYETTSDENGEKIRWINAASYAEADMLVSYYPEYGVVVYGPIQTSVAPTFQLPDYTDMFGKTKTQVQEMIKSKGGQVGLFDSQVWYTNPIEEHINQIWFDFNTQVDWRCNKIIYWLDMTDLTEDGVVSYLKDTYTLVSENEGVRYILKDDNNSVTMVYDVSGRSITLSK